MSTQISSGHRPDDRLNSRSIFCLRIFFEIKAIYDLACTQNICQCFEKLSFLVRLSFVLRAPAGLNLIVARIGEIYIISWHRLFYLGGNDIAHACDKDTQKTPAFRGAFLWFLRLSRKSRDFHSIVSFFLDKLASEKKAQSCFELCAGAGSIFNSWSVAADLRRWVFGGGPSQRAFSGGSSDRCLPGLFYRL